MSKKQARVKQGGRGTGDTSRAILGEVRCSAEWCAVSQEDSVKRLPFFFALFRGEGNQSHVDVAKSFLLWHVDAWRPSGRSFRRKGAA